MMLSSPFVALRHKNFRYYSFGMLVSTTGTWMQNIAQPWLAYDLTGSPFLLSLVGAMQFLPVTFFSLFAGVVIDRFPKKKLLLLTQALAFAVTLVLAILILVGLKVLFMDRPSANAAASRARCLPVASADDSGEPR